MHTTPPDTQLCSRILYLLPSIDSASYYSYWLVVVCVLINWWPCKVFVLLTFV